MKPSRISYQDPAFGQKFTESLRDTGFVVVSDLGIGSRFRRNLSLESIYSEWADFFHSEEKYQYLFSRESQEGYFPFKTENAKYSSVPDLKEFYHMQAPFMFEPVGMSGDTGDLAEELVSSGIVLLDIIESYLPDEVRQRLSEPLCQMAQTSKNHLLRILHYPPIDSNEVGVRSAAHEDINLLTLLISATKPGLEVLDNEGIWHNLQTEPGDVIINVGDQLKEATGGYLTSTTHRVVNPIDDTAKQSRYSMPLFLHARESARLSEQYTAGEYLAQRLQEIGLK